MVCPRGQTQPGHVASGSGHRGEASWGRWQGSCPQGRRAPVLRPGTRYAHPHQTMGSTRAQTASPPWSPLYPQQLDHCPEHNTPDTQETPAERTSDSNNKDAREHWLTPETSSTCYQDDNVIVIKTVPCRDRERDQHSEQRRESQKWNHAHKTMIYDKGGPAETSVKGMSFQYWDNCITRVGV